MLYIASIHAKGEKEYRETGNCEQYQFTFWIKRAAWWGKHLGKRCIVRFAQMPHEFEVEPDGKMHLLTPNTDPIIDPALSAQTEGS